MRRVAIVTGASRGIGRATARALAREGLDLYLVADGSEQELLDACAECKEADAKAIAVYGVFDLADPDCAQAIAVAAADAFGRIDVLINNAGIRIRHPFGEFTAGEFDSVDCHIWN